MDSLAWDKYTYTQCPSTMKKDRRKITKQSKKVEQKKMTVKRQVLESSDSETGPEDKPKYDGNSDSTWIKEPDLIDNWYCFICGEKKLWT
ncbi:hypothetical protein WA026_016558 [Henosepilachna vigintioctopunctata]|uniref:Uncharacterized protein n=1 Tax=Henosepilachna vigintioctopunctata TaxID=420089 RepID=A0AAW1VAQ5_9CUCU